MTMELTEQERELLVDVLEDDLRDLMIEVHRTDSLEAKRALEERQRVMQSLFERLGGVQVSLGR